MVIKHIDYSKVRNYDMEELFQADLNISPFYLLINGDLHFSENKTELKTQSKL